MMKTNVSYGKTMHRRRFLISLCTLGTPILITSRAKVTAATQYATRANVLPMRIALLSVINAQNSGMELGVDECLHAASMLRKEVQFVRIVSPVQAMADSVTQILQQHPLSAIVGGGGVEMTTALSQVAERNNLLFINTGCSADTLREDACSRSTFHVAPSDRMKTDALSMSSIPGEKTCLSWHASLARFGADTLNARFRAKFGVPMSERDWNDWFAIKALWETSLRSASGEPAALMAALGSDESRFDGHKGKSLSFRAWDNQLRQPLYVLASSSNANPAVEEYPTTAASSLSATASLDLLGGRQQTLCHLSR